MGHLQGITIDTKSLMLPEIILFFLAAKNEPVFSMHNLLLTENLISV